MPGKNDKELDLIRLGGLLRRRREALGVTQAEVARRCGMHATFVASVERGERNVSFVTLLRIVRAMDTTVAKILEGDDL